MERIKIDYGIDLGTTNSSICRMDSGEPVLLRTDTLREVMPSCISFTRKQSIKVGDSAYNNMKQDKRRATRTWNQQVSNTFSEFKRTMGTDTVYHSSNMDCDFSSVDLSAEVLKALKSFVTDESPRSVVVTVPAKFTVNQKTATMQAARQAGFRQVELLQEPIAAAMAYGLTGQQKNGHWLVFDFGGGTFDAALLTVEDGIIQVTDTEGDNYLGGKNLDYAIVDRIILPYVGQNYAIKGMLADEQKRELLRDALKTYAEEVKIQLSRKEREDILSNLGDLGEDEDGEEIELDMTVTQAEADNAMRPFFQKAVDVCKELLLRNKLTGDDLDKIILVGGPTRLPLLRSMLSEQIAPVVDTTMDPMTAVATGAALYASTIDRQTAVDDEEEQTGTKADVLKLDIGFEPTTVELVDWVSVRLKEPAEDVSVELVRGDKAWSSGKVAISGKGKVITVRLNENRPNVFTVNAYDGQGNQLKCLPASFVIIQGTRVGSAVLPYHIGISVWNDQKGDAVFLPFMGLEKNKPLPAVGVVRGRKTTSELRPGVETDIVKIPVYQADAYKKNTRSYLYEWVGDVEVSGDEVPVLIPTGSSVEVTMKVDTSEQMSVEVYFPMYDLTITKTLHTDLQQSIADAAHRIATDIASAYGSLYQLSAGGMDVSQLRQKLEAVEEENRNSTEKKAVLQHLKEVLRQIEDQGDASEWASMERQLKNAMADLMRLQRDFGNQRTALRVSELQTQTDDIVARHDQRTGRLLLPMIAELKEKISYYQRIVDSVIFYDSCYDTLEWSNKQKARELIDKTLDFIKESPTAEQLLPYLNAIYSYRVIHSIPSSGNQKSQSDSNEEEQEKQVKNETNIIENLRRGLLN